MNINNGLDRCYQLQNNLDLEELGILTRSAISDSSKPLFTGVLDGNGYTISNLKINENDSSGTGLFRGISGNASIQNLTLQAFTITGGNLVGALIGQVNNGTGNLIENIHVTASVIRGSRDVGGLIGMVLSSHITLSSITINGHVNPTSDLFNCEGGTCTYGQAGGVIGRSQQSTIILKNITNTGVVSGTEDSLGGIIGDVVLTNITMTDIRNIGIVSGASFVGGIIGRTFAGISIITMTSIINEANISGTNDSVGGLIGEAKQSSISMREITNTGNISGNDNIGGIFGLIRSEGAPNHVVSITDITNTGNVSGALIVGGIVGHILDSNTNLTGSNITLTGPGITTFNNIFTTGHVIGQIQNGPEVNLFDININRPEDNLQLVGNVNASNDHSIKENNVNVKDTSKSIFTDASITK
jgi:hypothetical protein